jgi:hypothetical protein
MLIRKRFRDMEGDEGRLEALDFLSTRRRCDHLELRCLLVQSCKLFATSGLESNSRSAYEMAKHFLSLEMHRTRNAGFAHARAKQRKSFSRNHLALSHPTHSLLNELKVSDKAQQTATHKFQTHRDSNKIQSNHRPNYEVPGASL